MDSKRLSARELDALVAELVFERDTSCFYKYETCIKKQNEDPSALGRWVMDIAWLEKCHGPELTRTIPHYSTDLLLAWKVVEKMRKLGWQIAISTYDDKFEVVYFQAVMKKKELEVVKLGTTVMEAICLAAASAQRKEQSKTKKPK